MTIKPLVKSFFDNDTNTFSYVVTDPVTKHCAVIDSVMNYDAASASMHYQQADEILHYIKQQGLTVEWILETHVHADHMTAAPYIQSSAGGKIAMSKKISVVQETFSKIYNFEPEYFKVHHPFDYLFEDGEKFKIGELEAYNIPTPGHTPACLSYVIGDAVFVGDTLFMPDYGTARCDFPNGSAEQLFDSVQALYQLPDYTRVFLCHDYKPEGRDEFVHETTIGAQKHGNVHIQENTRKQDFVTMRTQRDAKLSMPKLILPAIQINMDGGQLPEPEANGVRYLKIPLNFFN